MCNISNFAQISSVLFLQLLAYSLFTAKLYHRRKFNTAEELERAIITEWQNCHKSERFIDSSINLWRRRRKCVVKNSGGHSKYNNLS